ncbi:MAG: SAM-dependent DNA methyltransferase [Gammaproteobacteria bacterium]|nr:MAG: SAM-dependent DNA methyltransferase [Gammaproteobacteria bacterium]
MSISNIVKSIQDIMRKDAGVDGDAQRIGQMAWLLFLKIYDAQEEELELMEDDYQPPIPEELLWRNWASDKEGITGEGMLDFINNKLFPGIKNLHATPSSNPRGFVAKEAFSDAFNYMKNGTLLRQVVNKVDEIDFNSAGERHTFGDIYESILKDLQSSGNSGEFYTPRAVTRFMVDTINPKLGEKVMDPACGTGGFLACTMDFIKESGSINTPDDNQTLQKQIYGVEKKQLPHLLCTTNMLLHGIEVPSQIRHDNTLARPLRDWSPKERVNIVVANPPFGGMEEDGIELNFPAATRTRETADLFLQLIVHILETQGRAAIVLPDGTLFGEGVKTKIKEKLLDECNLHTIVRLPNSVFAPYTSIKTNILFFEKGTATQNIWYYEQQLPAGVKAYNKTKPMKVAEFNGCKQWWGGEQRKDRVENEQAWKVSIKEIKARNYNLDIKNPHQEEQIIHNPDELLATYAQQQGDIQQLRNQLKDILAAALGGEVDVQGCTNVAGAESAGATNK